MADKPKNISREESVHCPVCGHEVDITASYKPRSGGDTKLADFSCVLRGHCGIPEYDPCPLYVKYLEEKS
jgi:hypothetical protein